MSMCRQCKRSDIPVFVDSTQYYKGRKLTYYACRPCITERRRRYNQTPKGKATIERNATLYRERHPERYEAWKNNHKVPLQPCIVCGRPNTHRHHPDINKPLEITFLCPQHHSEADRGLIEISRDKIITISL